MADSEQVPDTPEQIAAEADQWLRERSTSGVELPELEIEENALLLVDGFIEVLKTNQQCLRALNETYWDKTSPGKESRFICFSAGDSRYAVQYAVSPIGNIFLMIRRSQFGASAADYWEEDLTINLIMNRTVSEDPSNITYINRQEAQQTGRASIENTPLAVGRAKAILGDLRKSAPSINQGDASRWQ